ncbi:MAG: hypothetical protein KIT33_09285 [Candidatus Kapabacteria bacterium]|nr:hypothetical protein [Ignavibacteriota bacterium]MCW5885149.1 hypothetical protein [Candidatus Kapabacteria bacterium]
MFEFSAIDFALIGVIIGVAEVKAYFVRKQKNKKKDILGGSEEKVLLFDNKKLKSYQYILYGLGGLLIASGMLATIIKGFNWELGKTVSYGLAMIYFPTRFKDSRTLMIGGNGIVIGAFTIDWNELDKIEWDKDISQKLWGVKFYKKGSIVPLKFYVNREYKTKVETELNDKLRKIAI